MLQPYLFSLLVAQGTVLRAPGVAYRAPFCIYHKTTLPIFLLLCGLATARVGSGPARYAWRHLNESISQNEP